MYVLSGLEQAAGAFTFDFSTVLCPSTLGSTPGVTAGHAETADALTVTFSRAVNGSTICSSLTTTPGTTPGSLLATIVDGGSANDTLTVTAPAPATAADEACGSKAGVCLPLVPCVLPQAGTVTLGSVDLGSTAYATGGDVTFGTGTSLGVDATGTLLTLTLGIKGGATNGTAPVGSVARYTPASGIKSAVGSLSASGFQRSGSRLW